ncbi:hypothetical protein CCACVL1_18158, partial [Corchorus capsularis]
MSLPLNNKITHMQKFIKYND